MQRIWLSFSRIFWRGEVGRDGHPTRLDSFSRMACSRRSAHRLPFASKDRVDVEFGSLANTHNYQLSHYRFSLFT
jgi:hypothetical protein